MAGFLATFGGFFLLFNVISQLFYVVEHAEHRPWGLHFLFSSKREPIHLFIDRDVDKNRLNTSKPFTVLPPAFRAINLVFHGLHVVKAFGFFVDKEDLSALLLTRWFSHALRLMNTLSAVV